MRGCNQRPLDAAHWSSELLFKLDLRIQSFLSQFHLCLDSQRRQKQTWGFKSDRLKLSADAVLPRQLHPPHDGSSRPDDERGELQVTDLTPSKLNPLSAVLYHLYFGLAPSSMPTLPYYNAAVCVLMCFSELNISMSGCIRGQRFL